MKTRICVNPPHSSGRITEIGIIWWWLFHPNDRIALIRKTFTAAADSLAVIKQLMEREEIRELFRLVHGKAPEFVEKRADRLTFDFKRSVTKEGSIGAYGINQLLMGTYELPRLPLLYLPIGALALWLLGQASVLGPARRAAAVPPAVATRTV